MQPSEPIEQMDRQKERWLTSAKIFASPTTGKTGSLHCPAIDCLTSSARTQTRMGCECHSSNQIKRQKG